MGDLYGGYGGGGYSPYDELTERLTPQQVASPTQQPARRPVAASAARKALFKIG